ncbi:sulfocyanin-like copper-binding protein [Alicyclobacillus sp. SO9]|uniref:sulfocyanin-like copper-binding protein n=1 Tax=Alicyclobacillus sp. SO9 TaxID=2665646 RepID=UPI0018E6E2C1|nr:sulfocyanin-like copper-binding protein [Alicyclobacillus sp. SO9]QQE77498.1 hypothetical protein GI364_16320 [Alicyclobacillus sp. SO9]
MFHMRKTLAVAIGAGLLLTGCGNATTNAHPKWMKVDTATKTVNLTIKGGSTRNNERQNFNGYANGQMQINIPVGYTVHVKFINDGGIPEDIGIYTPKSHQLAFKNAGDSIKAIVANPGAGAYPGHSLKFTFTADKVGTYRMMNLLNRFPQFPNNTQHGTGDWDVFKVTPGGSPSVQIK